METINQEQPDFLAVAGDMTTFGTRPATARILAALECVQVPALFTPGNAELRSDAGLPLLNHWLMPANRHFQLGALSALFPDTSTGTVTVAERQWLEEMAGARDATRRILITHYPLDALKPESAPAAGERTGVEQTAGTDIFRGYRSGIGNTRSDGED